MTFYSTHIISQTIANRHTLLKNKSGGEVPRKKPLKDFVVAGYRRIAQDKNPSATQLRALDRLAVIGGLIKLRSQDEGGKQRPQEIIQPMEVSHEADQTLADFMNYHKGKAREENHAADNSSPSGQPDLSSDGSTS